MNTDYIEHYLKSHLSEKRRKHIQGVRETAVRLAEKYGADPVKADEAALCHDMYKERDLDDLIEELGLPSRYKGNRNLAHSKVAAAIMRRDLGVTDQDLINAVSYHTTGRPAMSKLEQIIYLADAAEPGRNYPGVDELRRLMDIDLDQACLFSLKRSVDYIRGQGKYLDPDTLRAAQYYEKKAGEKHMESKELALEAARVLDQKLAADIVAIDVSQASSFADYLVIATGSSQRQTESLADDVEERLTAAGEIPIGVEGKGQTGWILLDFGSVVVNILTEEMRNRYKLENIWGDCDRLELEAE